MTLTDILIIYLACGAPFGVYYFSGHRHQKFAWLKSLQVAFFWIFFAIRILKISIPFEAYDSEKEVRLEKIKKNFEDLFRANRFNFPLFEFREILDRYAGLTLANRDEYERPTDKELEFSSLTGRKNDFLAAECLNRRNRKRLSFHQSLARRDFLRMAGVFFASAADKNELGDLLIEFVTLLDDAEARSAIIKIITPVTQSEKVFAVKNAENDLWKTELPKPLPTNPAHIQLQTMTATNSTVKD